MLRRGGYETRFLLADHPNVFQSFPYLSLSFDNTYCCLCLIYYVTLAHDSASNHHFGSSSEIGQAVASLELVRRTTPLFLGSHVHCMMRTG